MESLQEQLEATRRQLQESVPVQVYEILEQSIEEQQKNGEAFGLRAGEQAPDFTLRNAAGQPFRLYGELEKGPVVLTFYRGGWCPFCNLQLRAYQRILPLLRERGAALIALSPQSPDNTLTQQEKERLEFIVGSDRDGLVADRYRILFEVTGPLRNVLEGFGGSLAEYNATERWILPIPATFVVDGKGIIRFAHVDPNFMRRPEPEAILQTLQSLEGGDA